MKKFLGILMVVLLVLCSAALAEEWVCPSCGNTATGNFCNNCGAAKPAAEEGSTASASSETGSVVSQGEGYEVTKEYKWSSSRNYYYGIVIKNTSEVRNRYDVQFTFYDSENKPVDDYDYSVYACDPGYEVFVAGFCDSDFDHVECTIVPDPSSYYNDIHAFVDVTARVLEGKVILKAVNSGNVPADFIDYNCLFLNKEGKVAGHIWGYLCDGDGELKPGKTELCEKTFNKSFRDSFDSVVVYYTGRTDDSVVNTGTTEIADVSVSESEGCEVTHKYTWTNRWNYSAIVLKNTSGTTCGFNVRLIFFDENNEINGVSNQEVYVLDDGYEVMLTAEQEEAFDHFTYAVTPTRTLYNDVHSFVELSSVIEGEKVIISATNNGTVAAQFVCYHCLFLDADGNVIGSDWGYLVDNESEIKPQKTETRESSPYQPFDSVVVYFEGRCDK